MENLLHATCKVIEKGVNIDTTTRVNLQESI